MKLNIMQKLLLVVALPIITLLFFSINQIDENFSKLKNNQTELLHLKIMEKSSNLLHALQIERGLSIGYLTQTDHNYFAINLKKQRKKVNKEILSLLAKIENISNLALSSTTKKYILDLKLSLKKIDKFRTDIEHKNTTTKQVFDYYSEMNYQLISIFKGLRIHSNSKEIGSNILILNKLVELQEYSGKERALVSKLLNIKNITLDDLILFHKLFSLEEEIYLKINFLLQGTKIENSLKNIHLKYQNNFFHKARVKLLSYKGENYQIIDNAKEWWEISTNRIDEIHGVENQLFEDVSNSFSNEIESTNNLLRFQILSIIIVIFILLFVTYLIARDIKDSILKLGVGLDAFFQFLHFQTTKPKLIDTNSNDEINDMAQSINREIKMIEANLEDDKKFINEATKVVILMKDGNFSKRAVSTPHHPNLIELKAVLDELINLIADKIKEQTLSLKELNHSLEDRVYQQTLELEKQIQEITASRDKAIQAEMAKDEFLANMSHEIRTPLNAILGFVTILQKQIKDEKPLKYLNIIDSSGKSLLRIINDILDFSKIQSGKFIISPHAVNPTKEMNDAILLFTSKADEKNISYLTYIDSNLPQSINIDITRVKQIFLNLLSNAIKFTPENGTIKVTVNYENTQLIITIEDSGIGISKENIVKIFNAFEQADGSTTRKYGGTGLGLSISYKLAKLMDGDLVVNSKEGEGSTFILSIPA